MKERVRLIRITSNDDSYVVDAQTSTRVLGVKFLNRKKKFIKYRGTNDWFESNGNRRVEGKRRAKLDNWLSSHKKYVL